jgi:hypothetical protein
MSKGVIIWDLVFSVHSALNTTRPGAPVYPLEKGVLSAIVEIWILTFICHLKFEIWIYISLMLKN